MPEQENISPPDYNDSSERDRPQSVASLTSISKDAQPTRKQTVMIKKTYKNINDFIRVQILFKDGSRLQLTVDVNNSIQYLARQIEAEAALQGISNQNPSESIDGKRLKIADVLKGDEIQKTVDVYQLYDAGNLPLEFSAKIRDVLSFDDDVFPITSYEEGICML
jgi:hypothetical protein